MKLFPVFLLACLHVAFAGCKHTPSDTTPVVPDTLRVDTIAPPSAPKPLLTAGDIEVKKELLYDKYTLEDTYPYKDTTRSFKWETIREKLAIVENMQRDTTEKWLVLQNYKNRNREAPVVRNYRRNSYGRVADTLGVERHQSGPPYLPGDTETPER